MTDKNPTPSKERESPESPSDLDPREVTAKDAGRVKGGATSSIGKKLDETQSAIINKI
jgi:hypothetical protein